MWKFEKSRNLAIVGRFHHISTTTSVSMWATTWCSSATCSSCSSLSALNKFMENSSEILKVLEKNRSRTLQNYSIDFVHLQYSVLFFFQILSEKSNKFTTFWAISLLLLNQKKVIEVIAFAYRRVGMTFKKYFCRKKCPHFILFLFFDYYDHQSQISDILVDIILKSHSLFPKFS